MIYVDSNRDLILIEGRNLSEEARRGLISKKELRRLQKDVKISAFRCRVCHRYYKDDEGFRAEVGRVAYRKYGMTCKLCEDMKKLDPPPIKDLALRKAKNAKENGEVCNKRL